MIGLLLKKSFWNYWDRMGLMLVINAGYSMILTASYFLIKVSSVSMVPFYLSIFSVLVILALYTGMVSGVIQDVVQYKSFQWSTFPASLKKSAVLSIIVGVIVFILFFLFSMAFQFYGGIVKSWMGLVGAVISFWILIVSMQSLGWIFPLFQRMGDPPLKLLKKSILVSLDNGFIGFFLILWGSILLILSTGLILLIPGVSSVLILWHNALRLIMFKYDYWEENPEKPKNPVPWKEILRNEKELVGKRGISDLIRPGKLN